MRSEMGRNKENLFDVLSDIGNCLFEVDYYFYYSNFFKKKRKELNSQCLDVDAPVKIVQDTIFNFMGIDDRRVQKISVEKIPHDTDAMMVIIKALDYEHQIEMLRSHNNIESTMKLIMERYGNQGEGSHVS